MPAAFVRAHTRGASTADTSVVSATLAAEVPAGNLLVAAVGARTARTVMSLTKPAGETASWTKITTNSQAAASCELWAIKTTVAWASGTVVTATLSSSTSRQAFLLAEFSGVDAVIRGTAGAGDSTTSATSATSGPEVTAGDLVLGAGSQAAGGFFDRIRVDADTLAGTWTETDRSGARTGFGDSLGLDITLQHKIVTAGGAQTFNVQGYSDQTSQNTTNRPVGATVVGLRPSNVAPNAPSLIKPVGSTVVNRGAAIRCQWTFSDPNPGDVQSAYELRYRLTGAASWTTVGASVFFTIHDLPAGTLAAGDYEWQVKTADALGVWGPWSPSGFFTADDPPPGPTITAPVDGATVDQTETVTWSTPDQDVYELRRVADNAGVPDETTVYWTSGEVAETSTRSRQVTFETNTRAEHVQLRVKHDGLWSTWATIAVTVSYTAPPVPSFTVSADTATGSLLIQVTNPASTGEEPDTAYNDVYVDDGAGEVRRAAGVAPGGSWRNWTPVSGRDYSAAVRVVAVGDNGITSSSI